MDDYTVYCHTFPNGKKYIGITSQGVSRRWRQDGIGYDGQLVYEAIKKYGWNNIRHEILHDHLSKEEAEAKEIEYIKLYNSTSHENGYNIESGGLSIGHLSEETKKKLSEAKKGQMAGEKHWHYGQHWSDEVKQKIAEKRRGTKQSEETKAKRRELFSGKNNPMHGTKMAPEHKAKLQEACVKATSKAVVCIETGRVFKSSAEAGRTLGICDRTILYVCNKKPRYKTAGGYHWRFKEVI